jgi:hypothetical protein
MMSVPIIYILVEDSNVAHRATLFHVLSEGETELLRCWMTLFLLPADSSALIAEQPPFAAAAKRVHQLPVFRKAATGLEPPAALWDMMAKEPLVVLMLGHAIPRWLGSLTPMHDIGVLSPSEEVLDTLRSVAGVHVGLLKGMDDLREAYRVIAELIVTAVGTKDTISNSVRSLA